MQSGIKIRPLGASIILSLAWQFGLSGPPFSLSILSLGRSKAARSTGQFVKLAQFIENQMFLDKIFSWMFYEQSWSCGGMARFRAEIGIKLDCPTWCDWQTVPVHHQHGTIFYFLNVTFRDTSGKYCSNVLLLKSYLFMHISTLWFISLQEQQSSDNTHNGSNLGVT